MKAPVHIILNMINKCYDKEDERNTFDLGVQYMTGDIITFPKVEKYPGCGENLPGCTSYPVYKGLVDEDFEGGSFTYIKKGPVDGLEPYTLTK